jgi:hypothetical protein
MFYSSAFELIPKKEFQSTVVVIMSYFKWPNLGNAGLTEIFLQRKSWHL